MLTIRKRLIHRKGYWFSGAAMMLCVSVITSMNMQTTIRPDRLNAIVHHTVDTNTDDKQQTMMATADEARTTTATRNTQTSPTTKNSQTSPQQSTPNQPIPTTPTESPTPTTTPVPDPTPAPDPTPTPTDPPATP